MNEETRVRQILGRVAPSAVASLHVPVAEPQEAVGATPYQTVLSRAAELPALFDYQKDLSERLVEIANARSCGLISLPTGGGKTRTAVAGVLAFLTVMPSARVVWLAPSVELLNQAHGTFVDLWRQTGAAPDTEVFMRGQEPLGGGIWLNTPQALSARGVSMFNTTDLIVFDEAHQLTAASFRRSVEALRFRGTRPAALLGLSATPGRYLPHETVDLVELFERRLLTSPELRSDPVKTLQERGVLARLTFRAAGNGALQPSDERLMRAIRIAEQLAERGARTLIFNTSVAHSIATAAILRSRGVRAAHVEGGLTDGERRARLRDFEMGRTSVLTNQKLLTTGYDCPAVDHVILEGRVGSPILFEQMVGRAARGPLIGGTSRAYIWQFYDHLAIHGLPQSYYRYKDYDWGQ